MKLAVRRGKHGRGVFAEECIPAGAHIIRFMGPLLRYEQTTAQTYALQIGPDLYVGESGDLDDYVNHCCEPNAALKIDGLSVDLYALREIRPGEEIFFDYSTTLDEDDFSFACSCGHPACRGTVGDGKYLPEDTWRKYVQWGILPEYVIRSRAEMVRPDAANPRKSGIVL